MSSKVLIANRFSMESILKLKQQNICEVFHAEDLGQLKEHWETAQALLIRSGTKIEPILLGKLPQLKVIITATSGFDHIDLKACEKKNIVVMHTPNANAISAAELTWMLILSSQRKLFLAKKQMEQGQWDRSPLIGSEVHGKTLGIVGYGRIGQRVATIAKAFGMNILVHDPYIEQTDDSTFLGLEEVIRKSDITTFHVPLTTETRHMINATTLDWFDDSATLVNAARGELYNYNELITHLQDHPHFKLATDVYPAEPLPKSAALLKLQNVTFTPHVGATTQEALQRASLEAVDKISAFLKAGTISDTLPPHTIWAKKLL